MDILIGILIGVAIAVVVGVVALAIWYFTRDVRAPNFDLFEVEPNFVCLGDTCPILIRFRVTNVGADQEVEIGFNERRIGVDTTGEIALLPTAMNFPDGAGLVNFVLRVVAPSAGPGRRTHIADVRPRVIIMDDDAAIADVGFAAEAFDQPVGRLLGQDVFLGDSETNIATRELTWRFCKGSRLVALSMGSTTIDFTDFASIPQDSSVSAAVTVNEQDAYTLPLGQTVTLQSPLPIGDGIKLEASVPPPEGTVSEWPAGSRVSWGIRLHIACPD
jgi:hypothetical protein